MVGAAVRVLVVDDSAFMRKMVSDILQREGLEVVGTARDGLDALDKVRSLRPDVITLDVEMPRMDGVTFLKAIMDEMPTPVVMLSSLTEEGAAVTVQCLALGAFDCLRKPSGVISLDIERIGSDIVARVRAAATAQRKWLRPESTTTARKTILPTRTGAMQSVGKIDAASGLPIVVIASSTGGPAALHAIVPLLPGDLEAAVVIVQHLPVGFTRFLALRLDQESAIRVREATAGDRPEQGVALIAPAGKHLTFDAHDAVRLTDDPPLWGVRPAADIALQTAAERFGDRVTAVILTGMGRDGMLGAKAVHRHGGVCLAQNEATCVIYGMPRAAYEAGAVHRLMPLDEIAREIVAEVNRGKPTCVTH